MTSGKCASLAQLRTNITQAKYCLPKEINGTFIVPVTSHVSKHVEVEGYKILIETGRG